MNTLVQRRKPLTAAAALAGLLALALLMREDSAHANAVVVETQKPPATRAAAPTAEELGVAWAPDPALTRPGTRTQGQRRRRDLTARAAKGLPAYPKVVEAVGHGGAVATGHPLATRAALSALAAGGNAMDAAVAAALTIGVVEPYHAGLGGGGFAVVHHAGSLGAEVLDFRERAPLLTPDNAAAVLKLRRGCTAVAIPGAPAGLWALHQAGGVLAWETLFNDAIAAAQNGVVVGGLLAARIREREPALNEDPDARKIYLRDGAGPLRKGDILYQPDLAMSMRLLAKDGPQAFYGGPLSQAIVEGCRERGGLMRDVDFQQYRVRVSAAVDAQFGNQTILTVGPPSIGGLQVIQLYRMARHLPLATPYGRPQNMHLLAEAMRLSFSDRTQYASDGERADVPFDVFTAEPSILAHASRISTARRIPLPELRQAEPQDGGTTHISVVDAMGNAVSLTMTINFRFGAAVVGQGTGILLNDTMDDFSAPPGQSNAYFLSDGPLNTPFPGAPPLSSMSPTIVLEDGRPALVLGGVGGPMIPTSVSQVLINRFKHKMSLRSAVGVPRIHHQLLPDRVAYEGVHMLDSARQFLEQRGHTLHSVRNIGTIYAVEVQADGTRVAVADVRSHGAAAVESAVDVPRANVASPAQEADGDEDDN
ncbi:MAG: gamma-glutamyltransferase [Myxococcota bacterium]